MGNQLAASVSVNLIDVSPALELVTPLGGEGRNYFSSMRCYDKATGTRAPAMTDLVRDARPDESRARRHRRRMRRRRAAAAASRGALSVATYQPTGALSNSHKNYTQAMLRYDGSGGTFDSTTASLKTRPPASVSPPPVNPAPAATPGVPGAGLAPSTSTGGRSPWAPVGVSAPDATGQVQPQFSRDVVVKVFVRTADDRGQQWFIQRLQQLMSGMAEQLEAVDSTLPRDFARHILFYSSMVSQERFCLLQRPHVTWSLPERLASRPWLSWHERCFLCFQLLHALEQLHDVYGVVHGDIKANNILVQSTGWLYLADFAPFKPARVPANHPALFEYYYNTDDTRSCCLAPEKFTDAALPQPPRESMASPHANYNIANINAEGHTAAMDMFSAACIIAYILTDEPLFRLSEVLDLRALQTPEAREELVRPILADRGLPSAVLDMLLTMLCSLPDQRPTAKQVLTKYTPSVFPRMFTLLHDGVLPVLLSRPPDQQLQLLLSQLQTGVLAMCGSLTTNESVVTNGETAETARYAGLSHLNPQQWMQQHAVHILLPCLLHAIRAATTNEAQHRGLLCLLRCAPHCSLSTLLDCVLPAVLVMVNSEGEVAAPARVVALRTVCAVAAAVVEGLHSTDSQGDLEEHGTALFSSISTADRMRWRLALFVDLILPCVAETLRLVSVEETCVLVELAACLPQLLRHARLFLEQRQGILRSTTATAAAAEVTTAASKDRDDGGAGGVTGRAYGVELNDLLNNGWDMLQLLYKHPSAVVAAEVTRNTLQVSAFLGETRTQDDLIPLLTTAIASPVEVQRELYPSAIFAHLLLQKPQLQTLRLFLDEGLRQSDTTCLKVTLDSLSAVVRSRKYGVWDTITLVHQALPHMTSCEECIAVAACRTVESALQTFRCSDVVAYLECAVRPLIMHAVPLSHLSSCLSVIRGEVAFGVTAPSTILAGSFTPPGRGDAAKENQRKATLLIPANVPVRDTAAVTPPTALALAPYDVMAVEADEDEVKRRVASGDTESWRLSYTPTWREARRSALREVGQMPSAGCNDKCSSSSNGVERAATPGALVASSAGGMYSASRRRLRPIAVPLFSRAAHMGAIHACTRVSPDVVLTAGAMGEALWWHLSASELRVVERVPSVGIALTYLFAKPVKRGCGSGTTDETQPLLALGGTDSVVRLLDATNNVFVQQLDSMGDGPITDIAVLRDGLVLVSTATGRVHAVDIRDPSSTRRPVWSCVVNALDGAPSCLTPLQEESSTYAVLASTYGGMACLYDLRFNLCVRRYSLDVHRHRRVGNATIDLAEYCGGTAEEHQVWWGAPHTQRVSWCADGGATRTMGPPAILTATLDSTVIQGSSLDAGPAVLLGTDSGAVYRLHLGSGAVSVALQPHCRSPRVGAAAVRAMWSQPAYGTVFTAGEEGLIRKWALRDPTDSHTLYCPPLQSPEYKVRGSGVSAMIYEVPPSSTSGGSGSGGVATGRHHSDAILALSVVGNAAGVGHLLSASRDGTLTMWFNETTAMA